MPTRTFFSGASLILPDRIVTGQTLVVEGGRIVELTSGLREVGPGEARVDCAGCLIVPGFIDVHVHGVAGVDVLDGAGAVDLVAARLPRWGVTAFCPTSVACGPSDLDQLLDQVGDIRRAPLARGRARVLPAHLESNFINPDYRGAQPARCLRLPADDDSARARGEAPGGRTESADAGGDGYTGRDILDVVDRRRADIGVFTLAPEIEGGLALARALVAAGTRVSLGHSGASFEQAQEAIAAGARHATHLFNRMAGMTHRDPGLVGAVLASEDIAAELVCDGHHVHPAVMRVAIAAKRPPRVMAITDGTAGSGLAAGSRARLGGRTITVAEVARLDDGTMAGSVATMDRMFACLVSACGMDLVSAATMCATTPARELGLHGTGVIAPGASADLVILDSRLSVVETWVDGVVAWSGRAGGTPPESPSSSLS